MKKIITYILSLAVLTGCEFGILGMVSPPSDTVNQRFEQSMEWNENHGYMQISVPSNEYKFHVGTDIHTIETAKNATSMITEMRNDKDSYFALLLGDLIHERGNFPHFVEAMKYNENTQAQNDPIFATVGNHDLYYNQWDEFKEYFGTSTYHFTVRTPDHTDLFICLDTGSGTLGSKQLDWFKETLETQSAGKRHIIVFTHTDLFRTDKSGFPGSNLPIEETFEITALMQKHGVRVCLQGHNHFRHETCYRDVRYITLEAMKDEAKDPYYMVMTMSDEVSYTFVPIL